MYVKVTPGVNLESCTRCKLQRGWDGPVKGLGWAREGAGMGPEEQVECAGMDTLEQDNKAERRLVVPDCDMLSVTRCELAIRQIIV